MLPLSFATPHEEYIIKKISGDLELKNYLSHLGFITGASIMLLKKIDDSFIVKVKESRVALSEDLTRHIYI